MVLVEDTGHLPATLSTGRHSSGSLPVRWTFPSLKRHLFKTEVNWHHSLSLKARCSPVAHFTVQ